MSPLSISFSALQTYTVLTDKRLSDALWLAEKLLVKFEPIENQAITRYIDLFDEHEKNHARRFVEFVHRYSLELIDKQIESKRGRISKAAATDK